MLDDLRERASESDFYSEEETSFDYNQEPKSKETLKLFLGMTPVQRLVIAVMILLMICVMSSFFLLVTEKIYLPFG
ncbi:MAG: hypothetical protein MUO62_18320 [Anaerolineales bacterium]|nr:hypothetical protein [Anaerolineales bacterium]